jgi:hypothetical protein
MTDAGATMSREEIAAFLASLKKLRDGLDDFNCQLAAIDGGCASLARAAGSSHGALTSVKRN